MTWTITTWESCHRASRALPRIGRRLLTLLAAMIATSGEFALAQWLQPQIDDLFPSVVQRGTTQWVRVTGTDLEDARVLWTTCPDVAAVPQVTPNGELFEVPPLDPGVFRVTVPVTAVPGVYEARLVARGGISGPRRLHIVEDPVVVATPSEDRNSPVDIPTQAYVIAHAAEGVQHWYKVQLNPDTTWTVEIDGCRVDSRLEPNIRIVDPHGREVFGHQREASQYLAQELTVAEAGAYLIGVSDSTYQGGTKFGYSLRVHNQPRLVAFHPHVVPAKGGIDLRLIGYRLPGQSVPSGGITNRYEPPLVDCPLRLTDVTRLAEYLSGSEVYSGALWNGSLPPGITWPPFDRPSVTQLPLLIEEGQNDTPSQAVPLNWPCTLAGTLQPAADVDWYRFDVTSQETLDIRVTSCGRSERADPVLVVGKLDRTSSSGQESATLQEIARVDDVAQRSQLGWQLGNLHSQSFDPVYRLACKEAGTYAVSVRDAFGARTGHLPLRYRLDIDRPAPSSMISVLPAYIAMGNMLTGSGYTIQRGGSIVIPLRIHRSLDCTAPLRITLTGCPPGLECADVILGESDLDATLVVNADANMGPWHGEVQVHGQHVRVHSNPLALEQDEARAQVEYLAIALGRDVKGVAPDVRHVRSLALAVIAEAPSPVQARLISPQPIAWSPSSALEIPVQVSRDGHEGPVKFRVEGLPEKKFQLENNSLTGDQGTLRVTLTDPKSLPAGWYNVHFQASINMPFVRDPVAIRQAQSAVAFLTARLAQRQQEWEKGTADRNQAQQILADTQQRLSSYENQLPSVAEKQAAADSAYMQAQTEWRAAIANAADITELQSKVEMLNVAGDAFRVVAQQWLTLQQSLHQTRRDLTSAEAKLADLNRTIERLTQSIESIKAAIGQRQDELQQIDKRDREVGQVDHVVRTESVPILWTP